MPMEEPMVRPGDLALDELRRIGRSVVDAIAEYHAALEGRPVLAHVNGPAASPPRARRRASGLRGAPRAHAVRLQLPLPAERARGPVVAAEAGLGEAGGESAPLVANP